VEQIFQYKVFKNADFKGKITDNFLNMWNIHLWWNAILASLGCDHENIVAIETAVTQQEMRSPYHADMLSSKL